MQTLLVDVMRTNDIVVNIQNLDPCSAYFVRVSAVNCGVDVTSDAKLLDIFDSTSFSLTLSIPTSFDTCVTWLASIRDTGIRDIHTSLNRTSLRQCGYFAPCFAYSAFNCSDDDITKATFR